MNRSALLALLLLAIPYVAEGKASGRAAAVVPTCVHPKPSCYPLHCSARLRLRTSENETQLGNEPDHAVRPQSWRISG